MTITFGTSNFSFLTTTGFLVSAVKNERPVSFFRGSGIFSDFFVSFVFDFEKSSLPVAFGLSLGLSETIFGFCTGSSTACFSEVFAKEIPADIFGFDGPATG